MKSPKTCECGARIKVTINSKNHRRKFGKSIPGHDLCHTCWLALYNKITQKHSAYYK